MPVRAKICGVNSRPALDAADQEQAPCRASQGSVRRLSDGIVRW